jgi:excisionase family DNA binding protein
MSEIVESPVNGYIRAKEAAKFLGIHVRTFYNYVSQGKVPFHLMNDSKRTKRYLKSDLIELMGGLRNVERTH